MDTPIPTYLRMNEKLLTLSGLWAYQKSASKIFFAGTLLFCTSSQTFFQIWGALLARTDVDMFLETIPNILVDFIVIIKIINFFFNSHKMKKLILLLEEDWKIFHSDSEQKILNTYGEYTKKFTLFYFGMMYGTMIPFMFIPIVPIIMNIFIPANESMPQQLLFVQYEYLVDAQKYYYPIMFHSYVSTCAFINAVIAIDTACMVYVQHACAMFSILGYHLDRIEMNTSIDVDFTPSRSQDKSHKKMAECMMRHNRALEYANLIEDAHYIYNFFQLGINMICISFTGFQIVMKLDSAPDASIRFATFTFSQLANLFLQSYPGQQLFDHSTKLYQDIYNAGWYKTSLRTRKLFLLMSMRSATPCNLTAGKFYNLDLANFGMVLKTSMSYIMVLLSMREKDE